ncbi:MAG: TerC/Alx family metal homeostasis membrane protein [Candidatus Methanoplasma sp.]|jgi:tellurite resistance protein TerC|nr:TerC/Alx family metal homeostasis membrane protein [Candidatus Methanoplasma sp.]
MLDAPVMWAIFLLVLGAMFVVDMGALNRGSREVSLKRASAMTVAWVCAAVAFAIFVNFQYGSEKTTEFVTAYVIEEMMSIDNLFVFLMIFSFFAVPEAYQHKALFYGIIGAMAFRAVFIVLGAAVLERYDFVMYVFGAILMFTAVRTVLKKENKEEKNTLAVRMSRWFRSTPDYDGDKLFTKVTGIRVATPLFLCIVVIELTDIMFAFDSIPAVLAISTDTFIVYTSNIFAILGLRSLYFVLKGTMSSLAYMKFGLGAILAFVGLKMILSDVYHIDVVTSLLFICAVLAATVAVSLAFGKKKKAKGAMQ